MAAEDKKTEREPTPEELEEVKAKAAQALAGARKWDAEAKAAEAEARKVTAEAEAAELTLVKAQFDVDREVEKRKEELAANKHHYTYLFDKEVGEASVKDAVKQLAIWERNATEPLTIELVIDSPGGSVFDGFHLIDYIDRLQAQGHVVNTTAYGMAASMAGVLLQVGQTRRMGKNALILIHEASFGAMGSFGKVEDQVKMVELMHNRILELFASRSTLSKAKIKNRWSRKDWWIDAQESKKLGFIDEIG